VTAQTRVCGDSSTPFNDASPDPPNFGSIAVGDVITANNNGSIESAIVTTVSSSRCVILDRAVTWDSRNFVWSRTRQSLGFFGNPAQDNRYTEYDNNHDGSGTLTFASQMDIFRSFNNIGDYAVPYPYKNPQWDMTSSGIINSWPGSDAATFPEGADNPGVTGFNQWRKPLCNNANGECKYYLHSRVFRTGFSYRWNTRNPTPGPAAVPISPLNRLVSVSTFSCPAVTPAPAGEELVDQRELNRPCIEFIDDATGDAAVFYYSSAAFQTQSGTGCTGTPSTITNVSSCTGNNAPVVVTNMELGLPLLSANALDTKLADLTANMNPAPDLMSGNTAAPTGGGSGGGDNPGLSTTPAAGIRPTEGTPIATGLQAIRTGGPYFPAEPASLPAGVDQKNFVLILTDGNNNCGDNNPNPAEEARQLFQNTANPRNQAETLLVTYAPDAGVNESNFIARAGSGGVSVSCGSNYPGYTPSFCGGSCAFTCYQCAEAGDPECDGASPSARNAFRANSVEQLKEQLRRALNVVQEGGEFSATQSIVGTVFELGTAPLDPRTRYNSRVNVLFQSTFEVNGWEGRLKGFRNDGTFAVVPASANSLNRWDAGQTLFEQVVLRMQTSSRGGRPNNLFTFDELHGGASMADIGSAGSTALIRRRIFTSDGHGTFTRTSTNDSANFDSALSTGTNVVALWPPNTAGVSSVDVDPATGQSPIDNPLGIGRQATPLLTYDDLKTRFGACDRSPTTGPLPTACDFAADSVLATATAQTEARRIILAHMAGARVARAGDGLPLRDSSTGEMLFSARSWVLGESTNATPAVVTPPLRFTPSLHVKEWILFRDGRRDPDRRGIDEISKGFGLRNPDFDDLNPAGLPDLKPIKTVTYIGANDAMVHAFSAQTSEELWAFVPWDQFDELTRLVTGQVVEPHIYGVASGIRVADIFVPGTFILNGVEFEGRWRTVLFFGRGPGGKYYTAVDVTSPGPYTKTALSSYLPFIMWSRGNPDTVDGTPGGTPIRAADTAEYAKLGDCWSIPAVGNVAGTPEWRLFMGSGCSDVATEGTTLYAIDAITGDIIQSRDVGDGDAATTTARINNNIVVANAAGWNSFQLDPPGVSARGADRLSRVYIPDVKGRIHKMDALTGDVGTFAAEGVLQPFGSAVALLKLSQSGLDNGDYVFAESGNDNRVTPVPLDTPPFKMFGYKDTAGDTDVTTAGTVIPSSSFPRDFDNKFRGTVQPATAFNSAGQARVFFAGTALVDGGATCLFQFDTLLFAFGALSGNAVYDFTGDGTADASARVAGIKTTGIQVVGGQVLLSDSGKVGTAPAPPPPPAVPPAPTAATPPFVNTLRMVPDTFVCRQ
jgi:hypothetical protein